MYSFQGSSAATNTSRASQGSFGDVNLGAGAGGGINVWMLGVIAIAAVIGIYFFKRK